MSSIYQFVSVMWIKLLQFYLVLICRTLCVSLVNAITMSICGAVKFYTSELNRTVTIMFS